MRLFLAESRGISFNLKAGLDDEVRRRYDDILQRLAAVFASGIENKRFKKISEPYYLAVALDSAIDASLLLGWTRPERHPFPEEPEAILDIFFKGLVTVRLQAVRLQVEWVHIGARADSPVPLTGV